MVFPVASLIHGSGLDHYGTIRPAVQHVFPHHSQAKPFPPGLQPLHRILIAPLVIYGIDVLPAKRNSCFPVLDAHRLAQIATRSVDSERDRVAGVVQE